MHAPKWRFEWNPNTVVMLLGFAGGFVAWGYGYSELVSAKTAHSIEITKIWNEVKRLDDSNRRFDTLEYRVNIVEGMARDSVSANRDTTQSIAQLASDMRVTREILERLEKRN